MTAFIVCGSPAAGKSTYARKLAAEKSAALIDIDTVTEKLVRTGLEGAGRDPDDRDSPYFKATFRAPIYDTLFAIARENLFHGSAVVVGPFTKEISDPDWLNKLEHTLLVPVEVHYIYCQPEIRRARMEKRGSARDLAKLKDWEGYLAYYGSEKPPLFHHTYVDTSNIDKK